MAELGKGPQVDRDSRTRRAESTGTSATPALQHALALSAGFVMRVSVMVIVGERQRLDEPTFAAALKTEIAPTKPHVIFGVHISAAARAALQMPSMERDPSG